MSTARCQLLDDASAEKRISPDFNEERNASRYKKDIVGNKRLKM